MNKFFIYVVISLLFISCQKKEIVKVSSVKDSANSNSKEKKFKMYEMSEMAALMEQMYVENLNVKDKITKNKLLGKFPEYYLKINTAKFTDETDNDIFFKQNATLFLAAQKILFSDKNNLKEHYNNGIDACINCHKEKCGGPIPKIKKLYLK